MLYSTPYLREVIYEKNVLVIGGAGYIGSHVVKLLKESKNFNPIIYDNLSKGHKEVAEILDVPLILGDLGDKKLLKEIFSEYKIEIVMHFAAFIEVGESVLNPGIYYENNVGKVINLLNQMNESNIKYFVFSSTAATFGEPKMGKMIKENNSLNYNLGNGTGYSVKEIIKTVKRVSNEEFSVIEADKRLGDPAILIANPEKINRETSYKADYSLEDIIKSAWTWEKNKKY